ncbi:MAG: hypothetical protein ACYC6B_09200 [Thermoleophilia bacterium]
MSSKQKAKRPAAKRTVKKPARQGTISEESVAKAVRKIKNNRDNQAA